MNRSLTDGINFASKLSARRVWNASRVLSSYYYSRSAGKAVHAGMPISISMEPTTSCNLRCPECPSGLRSFTRPTGMLKKDLFEKVIRELAPTLSYLIFYFQGEPYLHPSFLEMIDFASRQGIYTATSTNGHFLTEDVARHTVASGLDRLIISIDGTTQQTYEAYRIGGNLERVLEGARNVVRYKKEMKTRKPHVIFQFLVVKPNEHQIGAVKTLAQSIGVDEVAFKTAQIYDYKHGSELIPDLEQYSRYSRQGDGTYKIKNGLADHCWKMWHSCVITWDGKVVPCCFDKDAHYVLGDLDEETFGSIWRGEKYHQFRTSLLQSRASIEMCRNCTEGTTVFS